MIRNIFITPKPFGAVRCLISPFQRVNVYFSGRFHVHETFTNLAPPAFSVKKLAAFANFKPSFLFIIRHPFTNERFVCNRGCGHFKYVHLNPHLRECLPLTLHFCAHDGAGNPFASQLSDNHFTIFVVIISINPSW